MSTGCTRYANAHSSSMMCTLCPLGVAQEYRSITGEAVLEWLERATLPEYGSTVICAVVAAPCTVSAGASAGYLSARGHVHGFPVGVGLRRASRDSRQRRSATH